jgi:hypothetical protein
MIDCLCVIFSNNLSTAPSGRVDLCSHNSRRLRDQYVIYFYFLHAPIEFKWIVYETTE